MATTAAVSGSNLVTDSLISAAESDRIDHPRLGGIDKIDLLAGGREGKAQLGFIEA